ncbi:MAG: outer membrane lipoprotein carrier protein LolA [Candidatus Cloacimonetes bacterium]|nr:outer membrane lipoprotein carrier protein LolA [Candidatus Cloacimonadota bacterium]
MASYLTKALLVLFLFFTSLFANEQLLEEIYENILIKYSSIKTYEANFLQENYWKELNTFKQSFGKIYYDSSHLLLDYEEPAGQKLLIANCDITIHEPSANQALMSDEINIELRPVKFISLYWHVSQKELIEHDDVNIRIKLFTPEKEQIFIHVNDSLITEFLILDECENSVIYKFSSEKFNIPLPESIFELNLPEDTNIIDNRK